MSFVKPYTAPQRTRHPLEARIVELRELDRAYLAELIEIEKDAPPSAPADVDGRRETRALELIADVLPAAPKPKATTKKIGKGSNQDRRAVLISERSAIERALELANQRLTDVRLDEVRRFLNESKADWTENTRQLALTIVTLWKLNRQRETLRLKAGGGNRPVSTVHHNRLLGLGQPGEISSAPGQQFVAEAIAAGIVTEREIQSIVGSEK